MLEPDTLLNNRYRILEQVGEGGMATVYRAIDTRLGRTVALKILHHQFARDEPFLQRFQQEAEFAASLGAHPNIVAIFDIGQDDSRHYFVMEFIEGRTLKDLIRERAPFGVREATSIGQQVASALGFAHRRGLVHRDVKPQNIMVTPEGVAKVTDFGIARSISASQLTRTGMVIGTVHYFSPEQAQGKTADARSDIYSLGIILFEMLTAHLPFEAETPIGVAMQHVQSPPPSPWDYERAIPARTVAVIMRALEKDPDRRYRDAAEFASALGEQTGADTGQTTVVGPLTASPAAERTSIYQTVEPVRVPTTRTVAPEPQVVRARTKQPPNQWKTAWIALAAVLALLAAGLGSYFVTQHAFGGSPATATATSTPPPPTARPKKRTRPSPTATFAVVVQPTFTPLPVPTWTPRPLPTWTPTPKPLPPTPTPTLALPTPTPAPPLPTPTPTPKG